MNSFERIWTALNLEEPDIIPTHTINIDGNVADMILGKPEKTSFDIFNDMQQQYPDEWVDKINDILHDLCIVELRIIGIDNKIVAFKKITIQLRPFVTTICGFKQL